MRRRHDARRRPRGSLGKASDPRLAEARAAFAAGAADVAARLCEAVLATRPKDVPALTVLGAALERLGRGAEALAVLGRARTLAPRRADAHYAYGTVAAATGDHEAAVAAYRRALEIDPAMREAHNNLGLALMVLGDAEGAAAAYRRALAIEAGYVAALSNLGGALEALGDLAEAEGCYRRALTLAPSKAPVLSNLGRLLYERGVLDEAETLLGRAVVAAPTFAKAHANLGLVRDARGDFTGAVTAFRRALACEPDHEGAVVSLLRTCQHLADWASAAEMATRTDEHTARALAAGRKPAESPFIAATRGVAPARSLTIARAWSAEIARKAPRAALPPVAPGARDRLTIGYLSRDFRDHAVAHLVAGIFGHHDRARFSVVGYAAGPPDDGPYRRRIAEGCDRLVEIGDRDDVAAARCIRADRLDILVELNGFTKGHRLGVLALRPAPVQVSYLGFPGSTGAPFLDYLIADRIVAPPEHAAHFSETLVRLPHCFMATDDRQPIAPRKGSRADWGLPAEGVVYASFNNTYKIDPGTFALWMRILAEVPGSVLWLLGRDRTAEANLRAAAAAQGIDPARLVFAARTAGKDAHLARLQHADLALDTLVCNGHTTTADALWAGVPVLTVPGSSFASRIAASQLAAIGLEDAIAPDPEAYRALAVTLGRDGEARAALGARLVANRTTMPLFDTARFVRDLERAYAEMWRRAEAGEAPRAIDLAALQARRRSQKT